MLSGNRRFLNPEAFPKPYWANTSSNNIVRQLVEHADGSVKEEMEALIEGGTIEKPVYEEITYEDIYKSEDNLWNFLFFTGYLKKTGERLADVTTWLTLAIPNQEVKYIYQNTILDWFQEKIKQKDGYIIKSNRESGYGRSDLLLLSAPYDRTAIILELKVADTYAQLEEKAEEALKQIEEKQNDAELRTRTANTPAKQAWNWQTI